MEQSGDHLGLHAVVDGLAEGAGGLEPVHLGGIHAAVTHHAHLGEKVIGVLREIMRIKINELMILNYHLEGNIN